MVWNPMNWEAEGSVGTSYFHELHLVAVENDRLIGTIDGCPLRWNEDPAGLPAGGWSEMVLAADLLHRPLDPAEFWVGAIGTSIHPEATSRGLSRLLLQALRDQGARLGFRGLLAPVRPILKARMPWLSIDEYAEVRLPDGRHFDPWVRTHERLGARIVASCPVSAQFHGSREQWESWSGMRLPDDGQVIVPEAIAPLQLRGGQGTLQEPSLWLEHKPF